MVYYVSSRRSLMARRQNHKRQPVFLGSALLVRAAKANPETPVTIRGDRAVVLERVVSVMDACRIAGLTDIGMMTLDG